MAYNDYEYMGAIVIIVLYTKGAIIIYAHAQKMSTKGLTLRLCSLSTILSPLTTRDFLSVITSSVEDGNPNIHTVQSLVVLFLYISVCITLQFHCNQLTQLITTAMK